MLNWALLDAEKDKFKASWATSGPTTRYLVIDNLLEAGICEKIAEGFHVLDKKRAAVTKRDHKHVRGKCGIPHWDRMTEVQREFFIAANSDLFCQYVQDITGITPIVADNELFGGGLHEIRRGGYLRVHTDFNYHPTTSLNRRLNLLLYLNPEWKDEWNGDIELWNEAISRPYLEMQTLSNRALLFETTKTSYHGHPTPLNVPEGVYRRSLAVYYYSNWPDGIQKRDKTGYQLTKQEWAGLFTKIADLMYRGIDDDARIVDELFFEYQTGDIIRAIKNLRGLRSRDLTAEFYIEKGDGSVERST